MSVPEQLQKIIRQDGTGKTLSVEESIESVVTDLKYALLDIEDGEYNGVAIKDTSKIPSYMTEILAPVLEAAAAVQNTVSENRGSASSLAISFEDRAQLGGSTSVNLLEISNKLEGAVGTWLKAVDQMEGGAKIGKPLAMSDTARQHSQISRLSDVLNLTNRGYEPMELLSDEDAKAKVTQTIKVSTLSA
jgi:hypothetical protein